MKHSSSSLADDKIDFFTMKNAFSTFLDATREFVYDEKYI
jgi:hypothetical protein